jgi:hypothetical protein
VLLPYLDRIINTLLFYGGWCWCLNDVARGTALYGLWSIVLIVIYQLYRSHTRKADCLFVLFVTMLGPLSDIIYVKLGLLSYHTPFHSILWLPPLWILMLWALVAVNIPLFDWLYQKWVLAALLGAIGGPLSYLSAVRLGGVSFTGPLPLTFIVIGGIWAILLPLLIWLSEKFKCWCTSKTQSKSLN